jgi:hypothetical protein
MRRVVIIALLLAMPAPVALGESGGAPAPSDTFNTAKAGGTVVGAGAAPVAHLSVRTVARRPRITVRFAERGVEKVQARVVVWRGRRLVAQVGLGWVPVGLPIAVPWRGGTLTAGRYLVQVHAHDRWGHQLRRGGRANGKRRLLVRAPVKPVSPPPASPVSPSGVFPVAGPVVFGDGFGTDRGDHSHQGQDLAAAAGTPVVAPLDSVVASTDYQKGGAGYYVVLNAADGRSFFFAHCQKGSIGVSPGQAVVAGAGLCRVGSTGRSTGPHLHFEIWVNGWRVSRKSTPVDPLSQLRAWQA